MSNTLILYETNEGDDIYVVPQDEEFENLNKLRKVAGKMVNNPNSSEEDEHTVGGGCGQLWFVQEWMRNNSKYAKPSIGRSLPVIHTPR